MNAGKKKERKEKKSIKDSEKPSNKYQQKPMNQTESQINNITTLKSEHEKINPSNF